MKTSVITSWMLSSAKSSRALARGRGADDLVARAGEHGGDHLADDGLVVDDENLRHDSSPASGSLRTNVAPVPTEETTLRSPPCARAISRLGGEPEARAGLRGRERLEQLLANARIDPGARVRDARDGPVAVALEPNRRGASRGQRLLRVDEQAQEDLAQPARGCRGRGAAPGSTPRGARSSCPRSCSGRARRPPRQTPVQRRRPDVVGLGAREPEQRVRDLLDLEPALPDEQQPVVLGRSGLEVGEQQVDEAEHPEERVVDLVREPADELSECAEPTRLEEGFSFRGG